MKTTRGLIFNQDGLSNLTNVENGAGTKSIQQKTAQATGEQAVAFGGRRYDKASDTSKRVTTAAGAQSLAVGGGTLANAPWSIAGGKDTSAYSKCGVALGGGTTEGFPTEAEFNAWFYDSDNSIARNGGQGKNSAGKVLDNYGQAWESRYTFSIVSGELNTSAGRNSITSGLDNLNNGDHSIMGGQYNNLFGHDNFVMGVDSKVNAKNSMAVGGKNDIGWTTSDDRSSRVQMDFEAVGDGIALGTRNNVRHSHAAAIGIGLITGRNKQVVVGEANEPKDNTLFEVGNGNYNVDNETIESHSNAFEVLTDGRAKVYTAPKEDEDVVRKAELDSKQNTLTEAQLKAVNSGIDSTTTTLLYETIINTAALGLNMQTFGSNTTRSEALTRRYVRFFKYIGGNTTDSPDVQTSNNWTITKPSGWTASWGFGLLIGSGSFVISFDHTEYTSSGVGPIITRTVYYKIIHSGGVETLSITKTNGSDWTFWTSSESATIKVNATSAWRIGTTYLDT